MTQVTEHIKDWYWAYLLIFVWVVVCPSAVLYVYFENLAETEKIQLLDCYDLKKAIANDEFYRMSEKAEHRYLWNCEK